MKKTFDLDQSHLVGDSLLVQPVVHSNAESINVYLPGQDEIWLHPQTLKLYEGGKEHTIEVNLSTIPYFQRSGTIIPRRERLRRSAAITLEDPITLDILLDSKQKTANGKLYIDDGTSNDYQRDQYIDASLKYDEDQLTYKIQKGKLTSPVTFERIRFYNFQSKPNSISGTLADKPVQIDFSYDQQTKILTIRKPELTVSSDWNLHFNL